jgi:hypothetical protein
LLWLGVVVVTSLPGGIIYITGGGHAKESQPGEVRNIGTPIKQSREEEPVSTI